MDSPPNSASLAPSTPDESLGVTELPFLEKSLKILKSLLQLQGKPTYVLVFPINYQFVAIIDIFLFFRLIKVSPSVSKALASI